MRSPPSRLHPHSYLQHLSPSILQIIAHALDPPLLKHTFRPPGHRAARRSLLAAASTCHALRDACFPLALRVFRSPELQPLFKADLGQSARELELKVDFLLARKDWWALVRKLDIEIYAKGSCALASKLAQLFTTLPHLESISLKLPTYRVFREAFTADLRASIQTQTSVRALCVDACSVWMLPYFTGVREVVVWSWPSEVDRAGGLDRCETTDGWRTFLFGLSNQAPHVTEVEVGGLSIYDVNEILPSLANYLKDVQTLRILHRKESHGSIPLVPALPFSDEVIQATRALWLDAQSDTDYEGQLICGKPGAVQRIVYFDFQEECGSCYAPREEGVWKDVGPALVLSAGDVRDQS